MEFDGIKVIKDLPTGDFRERIDPVKVCCGKKQSEHDGPMCPDGLAMCCLCFGRFSEEQLYVHEDGLIENVCKQCGINEKIQSGYI